MGPGGGGWIDVSVPVRAGMVHWPGDPPVNVERIKSIGPDSEANLTKIDMSAHTGTHMDAPFHFFADDPGIEALPLEIAIGPARVIAIEGTEPIDRGHVEGWEIEEGERILFRTANSDRPWAERDFDPGFVYVSLEAAELLGEVGVALVGVDYLSWAGPAARALRRTGRFWARGRGWSRGWTSPRWSPATTS